MADVGKVTPGNPIIPPVPKDKGVEEREREEKERQRKRREPDAHKDGESGEDEGGIDVYV